MNTSDSIRFRIIESLKKYELNKIIKEDIVVPDSDLDLIDLKNILYAVKSKLGSLRYHLKGLVRVEDKSLIINSDLNEIVLTYIAYCILNLGDEYQIYLERNNESNFYLGRIRLDAIINSENKLEVSLLIWYNENLVKVRIQ